MSYKQSAYVLREITFYLSVVWRAVVMAACFSILMICGCALTVVMTPVGANASSLSGTVHGGQQPIVAATIEMYAVGTTGDGSPATPLLASPAKTSSTGAFTLGKYTCPSPTSQVYLTATGGNPGSSSETNPQMVEMAALGPCNGLNLSNVVVLNEVTTIAAVYALAPFMKSSGAIGSGPDDAQTLASAFSTAAELASFVSGTTPGVNVPANEVVPSEKISTLANILSTCTDSSGGSAPPASACGLLFSLTLTNSGQAPSDTLGAILNLANKPTENVGAIFDLRPGTGYFQPDLPGAPRDWRIEMLPVPAPPSFSPEPGSYPGSTEVSLADSDFSAVIYYTTDGTEPSASSIRYTGAFTVSITTTIKAVAVAGGISSVVAASTYNLPAERLVFQTQPSSGLAGSILSPTPSIAIEGSNGVVDTSAAGLVTVQIGSNPGGGTLSGATTVNAVRGIATFPKLSISTQGADYTLTALCSGYSSTTSNSFNLANTVSLSVPSTSAAVGVSVAGTIALKMPAPQGGLIATLKSSNSSIAVATPPSLIIPPGESEAFFYYTGIAPGLATLTVNVPDAPPASTTVEIAAPVSISLAPTTVSLSASQTQSFLATIANTGNTKVTWSLNPTVGSISPSGLYTAPATVVTAQTVTVIATSVDDPTKSVAGTILLTPAVSVALSPMTVRLGESQTQAFAASVLNSPNTAITWTLSPAVGNLSAAGLYTAPASITAAQALTVTATSVANSTKSASATITLAPPVSVTLTPGSVTLAPSQTQAFAAAVAGTSNTGVIWSLSPAVGSISAGGVYTAPATIASAQTITVTATSVAKSTESANSSVSLVPPISVALSPAVPPLTVALVFLNPPSIVTSRSPITPALQVALEDQDGVVIQSFNGQVTLTLATNPTNAALSGTISATAISGVATFSNLVVSLSGSGYQLAASSPGVSGGVTASFAATTSSAFTRLYSSTSFWNTPIAANPSIDSSSAADVQASLVDYTSSANFSNDDYGVPLAYADSSDKIYSIPCTLYSSPSCTPGGKVQFPIPSGTVQATGSDHHLAVVYQALDGSPFAGKELDIWEASYDATNDSWSGETVVLEDLAGTGQTCPAGQLCNSVVAAGWPLLGGAVRPEEIAQGHIDHALVISTPHNLINYIACPASNSDGNQSSPALPEGAQVQLDPSIDVDAQNWPQWIKTIARALQEYGAYDRDYGGSVAVFGVTDQNAGVPKWASVGVSYDQSLVDIPWNRMRVIQIQSCNLN